MTDPIIQALDECEEYFDNRQDADCDETGFFPNREMQLLQTVREARSALLAIQASSAETDRLREALETMARRLEIGFGPMAAKQNWPELYAALASLPASEVSK